MNQSIKEKIVRHFYGSSEFIRGNERYALWIDDENLSEASSNRKIAQRINNVKEQREISIDTGSNEMAKSPHQFREMNFGKKSTIIIPRVSSESRYYLPVGLLSSSCVVGDSAFALYDALLWNMSLIASKLHLVWITTVCGQLETRIRYSNTMGWNTFPVPKLTEKNKADLTRCAEEILIASERHFPATIAHLYRSGKNAARFTTGT